MSTTRVGTVELWYNATTGRMEAVIRETGEVKISVPCPAWADKKVLATVLEKETCRRVR